MSQAKILALYELRDDQCPCGGDHSIDELQPRGQGKIDLSGVTVESVVCKYQARKDQVERMEQEKHEKNPAKLDGVMWLARPFDPKRDADKPRGQARDRQEPSTDAARGRGRLSRAR